MTWKNELYAQAEKVAESFWDKETFAVKGTPRESCWYAIMLLDRAGERDVGLANRILENLKLGTSAVTHALVSTGYAYIKHFDKLGEPAKTRMKQYIREAVVKANTYEYNFGNVNHPLSAWLGVLLAGQVLDQPLLCEMGWTRVEKFLWWIDWQHAIERGMGTYSEFNSPTYTVTDIMAASMAADMCSPAELKEKLIELEGKFWTDLALFWHHPTQLLSGPHSRAYQDDCIGHGASADMLMHIISEGKVFADYQLSWDYEHQHGIIAKAAMAGIEFHIPQQARKMLFEKQFPYDVHVNGFCGGWHYGTFVEDPNGTWLDKTGIRYAELEHKFPAHYMDIKSYQTQDYSLGTSSLPYIDGGQCNSFLLRYKRADTIKQRGDTRSFYTRYIKNDKRQGEYNYYERRNQKKPPTTLLEQGRVAAFQHANKAVVMYRPREVENEQCYSLKLNLLMTYFNEFDELLVGDKAVKKFPYEFDWPETVFIRDANVYIAIRPLEPANLGRNVACRLVEERHHLCLSIYNYEGDQKDFTQDEMFAAHNGFICEVAQADAFEDFEAFRKHILSAQIEDKRNGTMREVTYSSGADTLCVGYDTKLEEFYHKSVNGQYSYPERLRATMQGRDNADFCPKRIW